MTYATLMVHLEPYQTNAGVLQVAADFAERFNCRTVGIAVGQPIMAVYDDAYMISSISGDLIEQDERHLEDEIRSLESRFRLALQGRNRTVEWRSKVSSFDPLSYYLSRAARCADLIVTATPSHHRSATRRLDAGEIVLRAGRPVLVVPPEVKGLLLERVIVLWKDTREARRAIEDSVGLLRQARHIDVVEVSREDDVAASRSRLDDVIAWLAQHGIPAEAHTIAVDRNEHEQLKTFIRDRGADLVVAGAYGHSRLQEWVFGGVTRDLLLHSQRCSLLSH